MNAVFRLVWNSARKQWIAACEFARGRTKSGRVGAPRARKGAVRIPLLALLAALGLASATAGAATITWTNGGGDSDFANDLNWAGSFAPTIGDTAVIDDPGGAPFPTPVVLGSGISFDTLGLGDAANSTGRLDIQGGSLNTAVTGVLANGAGSVVTMRVDGPGSAWNSAYITVGEQGSATLDIINGGRVTSSTGSIAAIGNASGAVGTVNLSGPGSSLSAASLEVGNLGAGALNMDGSSTASADDLFIGSSAGGIGYVSVQGLGTALAISNNLNVGVDGAATMIVSDGAGVTTNVLKVGALSGSGSLSLLNGGTLSAGGGYIGNGSGSNGSVTIDGVGSLLNITAGSLAVGANGQGTLTAQNGGVFSNGGANLTIGQAAGADGQVTVTGAGSELTNISVLRIGDYGLGELTLADGGAATATGLGLAVGVGSTGTLNIGAAEGQAAVAAGSVNSGSLAFGSGTGTVVFNHTETDYVFGLNVTGTGTMKLLAGTTALTGDLSGFSGTLNVDGGTLSIPDAATLHTGSSYAQTATGVLRVGASDVASFGKLVVDGAAVFDDGTTIDVDVAGVNSLAGGDLLSGVVTATGGVTAGTFSVTDNSAMFDFTAVVNANTIDLQEIHVQTLQQSVLAATNQNPTPAPGAAGSLDQMIASPNAGFGSDASTLQTSFGLLSTNNQIARAVTNTLPVTSVSAARVSLVSVSQSTALLASRISAAISRLDGFGVGLGAPPTSDVRTPASFGVNGGDEASVDRHVWLKPLVSVAHQGARDGYDGNDQRTFGLVGGADTLGDDNRLLGVAFGYTHSKISGNGSGAGQETQIDGVSATLYGAAPVAGLADTTVDWQAGANANWLDSSRYLMISGDTAKADYRSLGAVLSAGLTKAFKIDGKTTASAKVRATYQHLHTQGYSESGAGALNLTVGSNDANALVLGVGGEVVHAVNDRMSLIGDATLRYDLLNERTSVQTAYAGGGSAFAVEGMSTPALSAQAGAGVQYVAKNGLEITAKYDLQGTQDYLSHTGSINLRWAF